MEHTHGPNCGCKDYIGVENANDLLAAINIQKVTCLNEQQLNSGRTIFKDYQNRFDKIQYVRSDCDGQILLIVPFTAQVKVRSICVIAKGQQRYANRMRLYINEQNVNFSLTQQQALQQFPLYPNLSGEIHNAVKVNKFQRVHKLIIHLQNQHEQNIEVAYVQIKGQNTNIKRQVVTTVYEIQPAAEKKDLDNLEKNHFQMG